MGRLTPKDWENQSNEIWLKLGYIQMSDEPFRTFLSESLQKLAHYEDLEEQLMESAEIDIDSMVGEFMHYYNLQKENRLIELPCAVGDTVYFIETQYDWEKKKRIHYIHNGYVKAIKFSARPTKITVESEDLSSPGRCKGADYHASNVGKTVFLTKEEAERKLKELEGDKE